MKEATGELNMTVIVIVAIVLVGALFTVFVYPMIKTGIMNQTCKTYGSGYEAKVVGTHTEDGKEVEDYQCCPKNGQSGECIKVNK